MIVLCNRQLLKGRILKIKKGFWTQIPNSKIILKIPPVVCLDTFGKQVKGFFCKWDKGFHRLGCSLMVFVIFYKACL